MSSVGLDLAKEIRWVKLMCQLTQREPWCQSLISREIWFSSITVHVKYTTHLGVDFLGVGAN